MNTKNKKGIAFYERGSWYHRIKTLNEDYTTNYGKKGGFKTEEEAEESYYKCIEEYEKQLTINHLNIDREVYLSNYLIYWYENIFKAKEPENTYTIGVAYTIYNLIVPFLKQDNSSSDVKLKLVSTSYLDTILEEVSKSTESAGNKCREVLNLAFKDALKDRFIQFNPVEGTKPYRRKKSKINILTKKELKILLNSAKQDNWFLEILLAVFCGLRKGEIMGSKFDDFDLDNGILRIRRQLVNDPILSKDTTINSVKIEKYTLVEKAPKKDSFRNIKIPQIIIGEIKRRKSELETLRKGCENFNSYNYVSFNRKDGNPHIPTSFNGYLYKKCPKVGIPNISVHGLRHMCATILIEKGVPLVKIAALLGHSSPNTTFEIYCGIMDERENILNFINSTFSSELVEEVQ